MKHRKLSFEELNNKSYSQEEVNKLPRIPVIVILENIRSLFNVGAFFRTADALRIQELILTGYTGRPPRKEIEKVALGSVESVPWREFDNTVEAIRELKNNGISVIAVEQTGDSIDFQEFTYDFPLVIIFGNEYDGIEQATLNECDACVEIPMMGVKQSLNVSTAFGIIGYELFRRLRRKSDD